MRFIDLTTKYHITRDKIRMGLSIVSIILVSVLASVGVHAILEAQAIAEIDRRQQEANALLADITEVTSAESYLESTTEETSELSPSVAAIETTATMSTSETAEPADTSATTEATESTTAATTAATTTTAAGPKEVEFFTTVYASQNINLRSGPGVEYGIVRELKAGDGIDVIAQTDTGWYKTYSGNYVLARYTQSSRPTSATTTTAAKPTSATTTSGGGGGGGGNMTYYGSCTITFYGPQKRADGTYSKTTATGTTCSQGRTCAADWGVFPAGTVIYVANDPLGGDGYYTVEDKGGAVKGSHIDIYADDPYAFSTTTREVYIVK